jgi:PAS domain S-box-containing protein
MLDGFYDCCKQGRKMTTRPTGDCSEERTILNERFSRLAQEKSFLQLTLNLINKIISVSGLDNIADNILQGLLNVIGGTNLILYYNLDNDLHYADLSGEKKRLDQISDELVRAVFTTGTPLELESDFTETLMTTTGFCKAYTWVYPLKIGSEIVGVLKIENLNISMKVIAPHLLTLFSYMAMTLNNEILGQSRLKKAYDKIAEEVTERRKTEIELRHAQETLEVRVEERTAELRASEEKHRTILQTAMSGIWLVDAQGHLTEVNETYCRMSGYSVQELLSMSVQDLEANETGNATTLHIQKVMAEGEGRFDSRHRRKDGTVFDVEASVQYRPVAGGQFVTFLQDITERKRAAEEKLALEKQFLQAQKLESLGVLAGGIAHDFNNILAIIIGYCSLVKMDYQTAENYIPEIEKAAERAAGLCHQMLAYAGKAQLAQTKVNMWMLVAEMVNMLKSTIKQNVVIKHDLSADITSVTGDASQLRQIVMNLVINAAEAIGEAQGEIRVSLATGAIKAGQSDKDHLGRIIPAGWYVCLEITDNGCGMDDETKQRIFEPFYTTKFTGRGLGMSAVLGIITAHGGALQLSSQPGQGTTFKVYLPVQIGASAGDESLPQVAQASWQGSGTILLVEDEASIILIAKIMLTALGFTVIAAANGKEALELYQKNAADITLVVTDMGMPVMDGYELFSKLKNLDPELPIIVSSGFGDSVVTTRIAREDIAGLVSKPYNFDQLREVLKGVVGA